MASDREKTYVKTQDYTIKKVYWKFLKLCGMGILASTVGVVFDSIIAGNFIKETAISAISMANPVYLLSTMTFMIFALGGATTCSQFVGQGEHEKTNVIFTLAVKIGFGVSLILGIAIFLFREPIIQALGASDPKLIAMTADYIAGLCISMPCVLLFNVLMSFISLDGSPPIGFLATVVVAVSKIALDILLCAVLNVGIIGVSLTTGISSLLGFGVCLLHFKKEYCTLKFVPWRQEVSLLGVILLTGMPNAITFLWTALRTIIHNRVLLSVGGVAAVTGSGVSENVNSLLTIVVMVFGYTLTSLLGLFYGEKDRRSMHDSLAIAVKSGVIVSLVCSVGIFIMAPGLPGAFGVRDAAAASAAVSAAHYLAGYFVSLELFYISMYTYQSTKHTGFANYIVLAKTLIFYVPLLFLLSSTMGLNGVWVAQLIADWLALASIFVIVAVRTKKNPFNINNFLMLPEEFDEITLYADVSVFYTEHSLELFNEVLRTRVEPPIVDRTTRVARNIIHQGPETDKRSFDIRIAEIDGVTTIRIRYGGKPFNAATDIEGTDYRFALGFNTVVVPIQ